MTEINVTGGTAFREPYSYKTGANNGRIETSKDYSVNPSGEQVDYRYLCDQPAKERGQRRTSLSNPMAIPLHSPLACKATESGEESDGGLHGVESIVDRGLS